MSNPFKIVDHQGTPIQEGRLPGSGMPEFGPQELATVICVRDGNGAVHEVMKLSGILWEPSEGDTIQLGEPNRDAKVVSQVFMVLEGRAASVVCVNDPATGRARA